MTLFVSARCDPLMFAVVYLGSGDTFSKRLRLKGAGDEITAELVSSRFSGEAEAPTKCDVYQRAGGRKSANFFARLTDRYFSKLKMSRFPNSGTLQTFWARSVLRNIPSSQRSWGLATSR